MTIPLQFADVRDWEDVQANFETIQADGVGLSAMGVGTNRTDLLIALGIDRGTAALTFSSSASASVTITHGLEQTPAAVTATLLSVGALYASAILTVTNYTSTDFVVSGFVTQGAITGTVDFSWVAVA